VPQVTNGQCAKLRRKHLHEVVVGDVWHSVQGQIDELRACRHGVEGHAHARALDVAKRQDGERVVHVAYRCAKRFMIDATFREVERPQWRFSVRHGLDETSSLRMLGDGEVP
jgi:hypothetical protein